MSTGDKCKIYGLVEANKPDVIRYIGQTIQPLNRRLSLHKYQAKNTTAHTPVGKWINSKASKGISIQIVLLKDNANWNADEVKMISKYRKKGCKLLNVSDGGQGQRGHKLSAEHRKKISESLKGGKRTAEQKANISKSKKGKKLSKSHCEALSKAHKGIKMKESNKEKLSKRMLGNNYASSRKWTNEQKKEKSILAKKQWEQNNLGRRSK